MYLHGKFVNTKGEIIAVKIVTDNDRSEEVAIGEDEAGVFFTADPVEIKSEVNDTFDHLLRHSASVRLLTNRYIPQLFRASFKDATVKIDRGGRCLFAGFIEPQSYSQPYNDVFDEMELNCIDALSALQYFNYKNVGTGVRYETARSSAKQRIFLDIITELFSDISTALGGGLRIFYDGSKAVDSDESNRYTILSQLSISDLLFLGKEEQDVWQGDKVLEEMLRYLNLHMMQDGMDFYIFSWESVKDAQPIKWKDCLGGTEITQARPSVTIRSDIVADTSTSVSVGEVYNQIQLTCKTEEMENVIESPLDKDSLVQLYDNRQKYITEIVADGNGHSAHNAFYAMCHDMETEYGGASKIDWYIRVKGSKNWIFPKNGNTTTNLTDIYCTGRKNQHALPNWLSKNPGAAIIAFGHAKSPSKLDNSPISKVGMTDYLVVSINGNDKDGADAYPNEATIKANIPYAVYTGNRAGGVFSPADESATNYIVISGSVVLNPIARVTDPYKKLHDTVDWSGKPFPKWWHWVHPSRTNRDGRYCAQKYWRAEHVRDEPEWDDTVDYGLTPFTGSDVQLYEFNHSAIDDHTDLISKVSVLACMLIIGDKCVVETGKDGQTSDFRWKKYKPLAECANEDEYYQQCFTIGFDPKKGDKLIGTEFDIQNNINYKMGIDAEGIAIPIRKSDKVSGRVQFIILGPVNAMWGDITRRHPTFFRKTKWETSNVPLLAHVSSIMVKKFEVKVYSDNAMLDGIGDNDIVYTSDTQETFLNKKDGIEFSLCSALTADECRSLGVTNSVMISTPLNTRTGDAVIDVYDYYQKVQAKPERIYVDSYYREYRHPRVLMEQKLEDEGENVGMFAHYIHPAMGKRFFVQGISRNLMEGTAEMKLKEINV